MNSSLTAAVLGIIAFSATMLALTSHAVFHGLGVDSSQYFEYSRAITTGNFYITRNAETIPQAIAIRTPGFPLLLSLGALIFPNDVFTALKLIHLCLGGVAVWMLMRTLQGSLSSSVIVALILVPSLKNRDAFTTLGTEWTVLMLLLLFFAQSIAFLRRPSAGNFFVFTGLSSAIMLVRPIFLFTIVFPILVVVIKRKSMSPSWLGAFVLGFSPPLAMMSINYYRFHEFALAPLGGLILFTLGSLLGTVSVGDSDSREFRDFSQFINVSAYHSDQAEIIASYGVGGAGTESPLLRKCWHNASLAIEFGKRAGWDFGKSFRIMGQYGKRVILENFGLYLFHLKHALFTIAYSLPLFIPGLFIPMYWIYRGRHTEIAIACIMVTAIHLIHSFLIAVVHPLMVRYYSLTFSSFLFCCCLVVVLEIKRVLSEPALIEHTGSPNSR